MQKNRLEMSFAEHVADLFVKPLNDKLDAGRIGHAIIGIATEAGELLDAYKKRAIYNAELDIDNIIEEIGDLQFYMQALLNEVQMKTGIHLSLEDCQQHNKEKLARRYPNGYTDNDAIARADKNDT